jgi:hypothetical protein
MSVFPVILRLLRYTSKQIIDIFAEPTEEERKAAKNAPDW